MCACSTLQLSKNQVHLSDLKVSWQQQGSLNRYEDILNEAWSCSDANNSVLSDFITSKMVVVHAAGRALVSRRQAVCQMYSAFT
jgi:hypothetical protein